MTDHPTIPTTDRRQDAPAEAVSGEESLFLTATVLAREGRYSEASRLLQSAREAGECADTDALDLEARMFAQQGMFLRAESCWTEALRQDPGNASYVEALAELRRAHDPLRRVRARMVTIFVLIIAAAFIWIAVGAYQRVLRRQDETALAIGRLEQSIGQLRTALADALREHSTRLDTIARDMRQSQSESAAAIVETLKAGIDSQEQRLIARLDKSQAESTTELKASMDSLDRRLTVRFEKSQTDAAAAMQLNRDLQRQHLEDLSRRLALDTEAINVLAADCKARFESMDALVNHSVAGLRNDLFCVHQDLLNRSFPVLAIPRSVAAPAPVDDSEAPTK